MIQHAILKAQIKDKIHVLINIILCYNKDTTTYLRLLQKKNFDEEHVITGRDFNCPPNPVLDKKGLLNQKKSVVTTIDNLQELDLVALQRVKNPEKKKMFYMEPKFSNIFCCLDY